MKDAANALVPVLMTLSSAVATYNNGNLPPELSALVGRMTSLSGSALPVMFMANWDNSAVSRLALTEIGVVVWIAAYVMGLSATAGSPLPSITC